jgi:hypothetical protein
LVVLSILIRAFFKISRNGGSMPKNILTLLVLVSGSAQVG